MGRNWLGVSRREWERMPHSEIRPESLWWYKRQSASAWADDTPTPDTQRVIDEYLRQCARGRKLPAGFEERLRGWLQDLNREETINPRRVRKPRRKRYWTIPAYALAHRLHKQTFMKRLRELEKVAIRLFPDRVPSYRQRTPLSEEKKQAIRDRFIEGADIRTIAHEFNLQPFRVGQICKVEKALLAPGPEPTAESPRPSSDVELEPF